MHVSVAATPGTFCQSLEIPLPGLADARLGGVQSVNPMYEAMLAE
jgi:hypothetical protein